MNLLATLIGSSSPLRSSSQSLPSGRIRNLLKFAVWTPPSPTCSSWGICSSCATRRRRTNRSSLIIKLYLLKRDKMGWILFTCTHLPLRKWPESFYGVWKRLLLPRERKRLASSEAKSLRLICKWFNNVCTRSSVSTVNVHHCCSTLFQTALSSNQDDIKHIPAEWGMCRQDILEDTD